MSVWNSKGYLFPIMKSCKKILFRNDIVAPVFLGCQLVGGTVQSGSEKSRGCSSQGRELSSDTPAVLLLLMWIIFFAHNHYQTFCVSYFFFHKRARRFYFFKLRNENLIWNNLFQDFYFFEWRKMEPVHREATCNSRVGPFDVQRKGFGGRRRGGNTRAESDLILKNNTQ